MSGAVYVTDSDSEVDEANLPSKEECEERCQQFAQITGTDTALAMFFLQDRDWNVERAINDFFYENKSSGESHALSSENKRRSFDDDEVVCQGTESGTGTIVLKQDATEQAPPKKTCPTTFPPILQPSNENRIRLLSWNIDGLDPNNRTSRTEGACSVLLQENPEIIFLQEIVSESLQIIKARCSNYEIHLGLEDPRPAPKAYFTAILVKKDCSIVESVHFTKFPTSRMSRTLLEVECKVKGVPLTLLTSHLESTAEYSQERKKQLGMAFNRMESIPRDRTVLFGGDLNLRDKEIGGVSALPPGVLDVWEATGKRTQACYTWDLTINDNKQFPAKYQPRCRFDRLYVRHSVPPHVNQVYFELAGIQRLTACQRFPSDHWGILSHFDILGHATV